MRSFPLQRSRRGVGATIAGVDLNSVFQHIADAADRGAAPAGQLAQWLISVGVTVDGVRQVLNTAATSAEITGAERAYIEGEIAQLNSGYGYTGGRNNGILLALGAAALIYAVSKN